MKYLVAGFGTIRNHLMKTYSMDHTFNDILFFFWFRCTHMPPSLHMTILINICMELTFHYTLPTINAYHIPSHLVYHTCSLPQTHARHLGVMLDVAGSIDALQTRHVKPTWML